MPDPKPMQVAVVNVLDFTLTGDLFGIDYVQILVEKLEAVSSVHVYTMRFQST